ncbi:hypothetical protein CVV26_03075 [Candidatus Kuenenbacteria bacterium HGW-Kuenenbacteria-1]|uniref:Lipoprotein n=1 Tax=Candidatus Kuenenbacteria bacterium HGW-Kuenenbacteria-1 TaxID=2013812 RepID=A0A2N1UMY8_9BACT|nr:MAG: hypothetical protein CVV26_03075 [Candidatus Kuenenbacteria bacterium HGW-Kuenenbacteria-1]
MFFRSFKIFIFIFIIIVLPVLVTGCKWDLSKKTFSSKNEEIKKELMELVKKEYKYNVKVEIINKTIGVYFPLSNLLEDDKAEEKKLNKEVAEKIDHVIFLTHRVALSSDNNLDFYVIKTVDMENGNELSVVGYFYDVYRARLANISKGEFSQRLLKGLNKNDKIINDWEGKNFKMNEIFLPDFLATQIAQRIKIATTKKKDETEKNNFFSFVFEDKKLKEKFEAKEIQWALKDKIFTFVLEIPDYQEENVQEIFNLILKTTADVLYAYDFDYSATRILIKNKTENKKIFFINKKDLELFRNRKIKIEELID